MLNGNMVRRAALIGIVLVVALLGAYAPQTVRADEGYTPTFQAGRCQNDIPDGYKVDCGWLIVPENRSQPADKTIKLHVEIVRSKAENPRPVVYLEGGPGGSGTMSLDYWVKYPLLDQLLETSDFILLDQRGTGYSKPSLDCPEMSRARNFRDGITRCRARLVKAGVDLSAYNSVENAADVADLRIALGYDSWDIIGISYGTRLALNVMRDHPEGIRSVILDGVYPTNVNFVEELGPDTVHVFNVLFDGCAQSEACNTAYPDLKDAFYKLVSDLNDTPAQVKVSLGQGSRTFDAEITGDDLVDDLFQAMYATELIPRLPKYLYDASQGNFDGIAELHGFTGGAQRTGDPALADSEGMHLSVNCTEEVPFNSDARVRSLLKDAPTAIRQKLISDSLNYFSECKLWNVTKSDTRVRQPVRSSIPTLVMNGEYDPITPPTWGKIVARSLSKNYYFLFPGVGHSSIGTSDCADTIVLAFLDTPTRRPNSACIQQLAAPEFVIG